MAELVRRSARLIVKAAKDVIPEPVPPSPSPLSPQIDSGLSPAAMRLRRYRERLKADPTRYATYKERDRERAKEYRVKLTEREKRGPGKISGRFQEQGLFMLRSRAPYIVSWRQRSCFCPPCKTLEGDCINLSTCGPWHVFDMHKTLGRRAANAQGQRLGSPHVLAPHAPAVRSPDHAADLHPNDAGDLPIFNSRINHDELVPASSRDGSHVIQPESQAMAERSTPLETDADCEVNSCVVVRYPDRCYPGVVTEYIDKDTRRIRFLHPHTTKKTFFVYPAVADVQLVSMDMIVAKVFLVPTCNSMREWRVECYDF